MTPGDFQRIALSMPNATEKSHMNHPDFRVDNKVFATLGYPDSRWAMVKLKPWQQDSVVASEPDIFRPVNGAWGRRGSTQVLLERLEASMATAVIRMAWENVTTQ